MLHLVIVSPLNKQIKFKFQQAGQQLRKMRIAKW